MAAIIQGNASRWAYEERVNRVELADVQPWFDRGFRDFAAAPFASLA